MSTTELEADLAALRAEIAELRAGEDDTPAPPEAVRSPGQWLYRLNRMTGAERLRWLDQVREAQDRAGRCSGFDSHAQKIGDLEAERDHLRNRVRELEARPTHHAYEAACEALERRRVELVNALGGELQPGLIPFGDAVQIVRSMRAVQLLRKLEDAEPISPTTTEAAGRLLAASTDEQES